MGTHALHLMTFSHFFPPFRLSPKQQPTFQTHRWPWPGGDSPSTALSESTDAAKAAAADVLGALMSQPSHGPRVALLLGKLLPPGLVAAIGEGPPAAVLRALGQVKSDRVVGVLVG